MRKCTFDLNNVNLPVLANENKILENKKKTFNLDDTLLEKKKKTRFFYKKELLGIK